MQICTDLESYRTSCARSRCCDWPSTEIGIEFHREGRLRRCSRALDWLAQSSWRPMSPLKRQTYSLQPPKASPVECSHVMALGRCARIWPWRPAKGPAKGQWRWLRHLMAPPELVEIAKHRCFQGTLYRFEHISPVGRPCLWCGSSPKQL